MDNFSLLVKPSSADCNIRCTYCFYLEKKSLYPGTQRHQMSTEVLEQMISTYMATPQRTYSFGWQGGEPTLMGREFFKKITEFQEKHGRRGARVANGLQTNGILMTDALAEHLGKYQFLVGVSIDGPEEIHNVHRLRESGRGTHGEVLRGVELLQKHNVEFNILTLVSSANVDYPREVYRYLCDMGVKYHQYIPCVEFDDQGNRLPYGITGKQWGEFMLGIFDEWYGRDTERVSVRHFDSVLTMLVDGYANACILARNCQQYFVVEHNGDIYPCDFFVQEEKRLGNIMTDSWEKMKRSPIFRQFGIQKNQWNDECSHCSYLKLCAGDCQKNRFYGKEDPGQISYLCDGWKAFYGRTLPEFEKLASQIRRNRAEAQRQWASPMPTLKGKSPGRNDPCPCGSGRKYKHCHGR